ncbi:hypothetical protein [Nonomuraea zeae]|uniref:Uncharacterized protein n=1 Tax=Nonomuraea zeae TaxID=1642303 RepID=A0A5S4HJQ1_9ACTN|nr:hypothetical protein [Nonomuraea zeae]TMR39670.1 hypothetical protein ETD85_01285 [Nonomuraea zeae]
MRAWAEFFGDDMPRSGSPVLVGPAPTPLPSRATYAPSRATYEEGLVNEFISGAMACVDGTPKPASEAPFAPLINADGLTELLNEIFGIPEAACATPGFAATPTTATTSLLGALGVTGLLDTLVNGPAACQAPAAAAVQAPAQAQAQASVQAPAPASSSRSLLDALGVTDLLRGLVGS